MLAVRTAGTVTHPFPVECNALTRYDSPMRSSAKWQVLSILACAMLVGRVHADPAATQPSTMAADTAEVKEIRRQLLELDNTMPKMSLEEVRKTFHTANNHEATYADYLAHEVWEANKTEQAIRDKWGPSADEKFARITQFTTREDDAVCHIAVDGNTAIVSWDIKDMTPEKMIKEDGHWQMDMHAMWDDWIKNDPNLESDKRSTIKIMKQAREDIAAEKFDDADAFIADFKSKWDNGN